MISEVRFSTGKLCDSAFLPKFTKKIADIIDNGGEMDTEVANAVAEAMMNWAIEKGATHYTHWFQPMTGITAFTVRLDKAVVLFSV